MSDPPVFRFQSGDRVRKRSVSDSVRTATLDLPVLPARLVADCEREIARRLGLEAGDVEPLSLPRARVRWPDHAHCVQAAVDWARDLGLDAVLASSDMALMACRGAREHHDGAQYGDVVFCNLFVSDDKGLDVLFPATGRRIPLARGTVLLFDTCQPHSVVRRGSKHFDEADFAPGRDCTQLFLTWELPVEHEGVARAMGITFDLDGRAFG